MNSFKILKLSTFILVLNSMYVWFTWEIPAGIINVLAFLICVNYQFVYKSKLKLRSKWFALIFAITLVYQNLRVDYGIATWLSNLLFYIIVLYYISLPEDILFELLSTIKKWMVRILVPSLVIHFFIMVTHFQSPFLLDFFKDSHYGIFSNYFLYIAPLNGKILRFNGPFLEPGYLGMITSFLLYAFKFDFKDNHVRWILVFNLLTFSLAGYVLTFIAWLLTAVTNKWKLIATFLVISIGALLISNLPSDSIFREMILDRLENDSEKGIAGNNRVTDGIYFFLDNMDKNEFLFGYGEELMKDADFAGSGYLMTIVYYGVMALILWFLCYFSLAMSSPNKRYALFFLIIIVFSSIQRFYPMWFSWIFIFIASIYSNKISRQPSDKL